MEVVYVFDWSDLLGVLSSRASHHLQCVRITGDPADMQVLTQEVWGGTCCSHLTSSKVMLTPLVHEPHFK